MPVLCLNIGCVLQAEQLRKSACVPEGNKEYDPDWHRTCTIYAGSMVQQVQQPAPMCKFTCATAPFIGCIVCPLSMYPTS